MLDAQLVLWLELLTHKKNTFYYMLDAQLVLRLGLLTHKKNTFYYMLDAQLVLRLELLTHKKKKNILLYARCSTRSSAGAPNSQKKHFIICSMLNSFFGWGS